MRTFRLTDADFAALAAGRPSPATVGVLRRAQASRHLLLLSEIRRLGGPIPEPLDLYDPLAALHTTVLHQALRAGTTPPPPQRSATNHLLVQDQELTLRVRLEDTDPLRAHLGLPPSEQLTPAEVAEWQRLLSAAWHLLTTRHREAAEVMAAVLRVIVPVLPDPGSGGLSATSTDAFGAVAISTPADPRSFAVGLLHECQHSLLNATTTLFDLVTPGGPRVCSPWRDDPRPLSGLLHGAYAYQSVTRFWRTEAAVRIPRQRPARTALPAAIPAAGPREPAAGELRGRLAEFEFVRWRAAVVSASQTLLDSGHLTGAGARFVRAMHDEVAAWPTDSASPRVARLAAWSNAEHDARWRLRNLVVPADSLAELLLAWRDGRPAPAVESELRSAGGRRLAGSERLRMVHELLKDEPSSTAPDDRRDSDAEVSADPATGLPEMGDPAGFAVAGLRPGDVAYLDGEGGAAFAAYLKGLGVGDLDLWAGIAVVSPYVALRERPELIRDVWLALLKQEKVGLADVAAWLAGSLMSS